MSQQLEMFDNPVGLFNKDSELKTCTHCGNSLPLSNYYLVGRRRLDGTNKLRNKCKDCFNKQREAVKDLKAKYPKPSNNYSCPICECTSEDLKSIEDATSKGYIKTSWCLDHDHDTMQFRGWLCNTCNSAMGWFRDDINRLRRAVKYLEGKL